MMTLKDIPDLTYRLWEWCLAQDDLTGFSLEIVQARKYGGYRPDPECVRLILVWRGGLRQTREFPVYRFRPPQDHTIIRGILDSLARQARARMAEAHALKHPPTAP
jgi:hypothetical protein